MPVFLSVKFAWLVGKAELCARRQVRLLVAFREEPLRFEGRSGVQTQDSLRNHAIAQNDYRETRQLELNSAIPQRGNLCRAH